MSKWSETGILRKKRIKENYDDLLVFGYACKLFRDDEKALYIDQGKHLIPWMGDEKLKIDRYDGRGALSDLSSCEASKEGYDAMRWLGLNESERKIEQLCDEERYYSLHTNEEEEAMYKEEELKRLQTNAIQYSYDVPRDPEQENSQDSIPTCEEEVKAFVPPPELDVPVDITIPKTVKENARIEKTALFVSKQGPQMEILIKAKQSDNAQFNFMNQSDALYKYYRHVLCAIKAGRYKTQMENDKKEEDAKEENISVDEHYLHPSLVQPQAPPLVSGTRLPVIPYKPTADCAYTQLVTRIQGNNPQTEPQQPPLPPPSQEPLSQQTPDQQQQYYQYYYSIQYYEYYKQIAQQYAAQAGCDPQNILQNPQLQEQIQTQASHYAQAACNQYINQNTNNPYAQIVTNLAQNIKENVAQQISQQPVKLEPPPPKTENPKTEVKNPLLSLVHYSSDSEEEEEVEERKPVKENSFKVPPDDVAVIIDKMANYVSKNGAEFENIVRAKNDPRFEFLKSEHEYYNYYKHKVEGYTNKNVVKEETVDSDKETKEKKPIAPVSFSIKKPRDESPKEIKSALPVEESDEDLEDAKAKEKSRSNSPVPNIVPSIKVLEVITIPAPEPVIDVIDEKPEVTEIQENDEKNGLDGDDPILEMIDLTDDLEERRDAKRAEDKIKDKLALAVKGKLSKSKDRALQMERRKRAAMFLKLKHVENVDEKSSVTKIDSGSSDGDDRVSGKKEEILKIDDSDTEEEVKEKKSSSRKKKSHKRKSSKSRSRHESRSRHKKSKKRRRRSRTRSPSSSS